MASLADQYLCLLFLLCQIVQHKQGAESFFAQNYVMTIISITLPKESTVISCNFYDGFIDEITWAADTVGIRIPGAENNTGSAT